MSSTQGELQNLDIGRKSVRVGYLDLGYREEVGKVRIAVLDRLTLFPSPIFSLALGFSYSSPSSEG